MMILMMDVGRWNVDEMVADVDDDDDLSGAPTFGLIVFLRVLF